MAVIGSQLSIPSRMLQPVVPVGTTAGQLNSFQFLLGCFEGKKVKRVDSLILNFQFLLGCFFIDRDKYIKLWRDAFNSF